MSSKKKHCEGRKRERDVCVCVSVAHRLQGYKKYRGTLGGTWLVIRGNCCNGANNIDDDSGDSILDGGDNADMDGGDRRWVCVCVCVCFSV